MNKKTLILLLLLVCNAFLPPLYAQQYKVISFNIRSNNYPHADGVNCWNNRKDAVIKMIRNEDPMVFGLQEALLDQLTFIDNNFIRKYRRIGVGRDNGISRGEHLAIYYDYNKVDLVFQKTRWLSERPQQFSIGWDAACMRTVTIARFRIKETGKEFLYLNTHLDHVGKVAREESIKLLLKLIDQYNSDGIPVILGGDFNATIDDDIFNPLISANFVSARFIAKRRDYSYTYNGFGNGKPAIFDYIFVKNIQVIRFKTLVKGYGVPYISDHYPIEIIFSL
ncbi:MAG: endonuclease/exonuclease/phosphatase family protein [Bacteroidales bacterium]|nr:endonuclease/exonuclease/phosphatase family protein [Bacteroidales bacterium]